MEYYLTLAEAVLGCSAVDPRKLCAEERVVRGVAGAELQRQVVALARG